MPTFIPLERVVRRAPLGVAFSDLALGGPVTDGLVVTAAPIGLPERARPALRSPVSGIYGFDALRGLEPYGRGERPASDWCSPITSPFSGAPANFVVAVRDLVDRFLPQTLTLCLPSESLLRVQLFSAPTRPAAVGLAVVRGELTNSNDGLPAAWALVSFSFDALTTYVSLADAHGAFVAFLPYAETLPALVGSPPHGAIGLEQLTWPITVRAFYAPGGQQVVAGLRPDAPPVMGSLLGQAPAQIEDLPGVPGLSVVRTLRFGAELRVATHGRSDLLLRPV